MDDRNPTVAATARQAAPVLRRWLDSAERVLISAGAGLSAAAGYDYADTTRFAQLFPFMIRHGYRARYELIGAPLRAELLWGYWATHVADIRFGTPPMPIYERLRALVGERDHFVMTSNVDGLFARSGFAPHRVYTPQGDYARLQCVSPCSRDTWEWKPELDALLADLDADTGCVRDRHLVPACPRCHGAVFLNVNLGRNYVQDPYRPHGRELLRWLAAGRDAPLLVLELGAGFSTPGVIRWPSEAAAASVPGARLVRVNPDHPEVPAHLDGRSLSVRCGAGELLAALAWD